jgi:hypothetical protein
LRSFGLANGRAWAWLQARQHNPSKGAIVPISPQTDPDFKFKAVDLEPGEQPPPDSPAELGPLAQLLRPDGKPGKWEGKGFNTIWRPHELANGGQDRFLELNLTSEKLVFTRIPGKIPNRGLLMPDIDMVGLTYMQEIKGLDPLEGLHVEPGIWASVPPTSDPAVGATVVRMASIPHGTTILAQGSSLAVDGGPHIEANNIIPFPIATPPPPNADFAAAEATFTELNLAIDTPFRQASKAVTRAMVENPNSVLLADIAGQKITSTTVLIVSTKHEPVPGGGTSNTAFLEDGKNPPGGNANAVEVDAIFWIETVAGAPGEPDKLQLQYTQLVQLNFNGLSWPHVSVATLKKV